MSVAIQFRAARKAAGLPKDLVLYCGRHTFGTDALAGTGNLAAVMRVMGQTSTAAAMGYQHPELDAVRDAINRRNERNAMSQTASQRCDTKEFVQ
jgi:integrase